MPGRRIPGRRSGSGGLVVKARSNPATIRPRLFVKKAPPKASFR